MMAGSQWNTSTRAHRQGGEAEDHGADQHPNVWEGHNSFHIIDQKPRLADVCILQGIEPINVVNILINQIIGPM